MEQEYKKYFGVITAPTNFTRLEYVAKMLLKTITTQTIDETDTDYITAVVEQINYLDNNQSIIEEVSGGSISLGKYSTSGNHIKTTQTVDRISPIAYNILLNMGYLYCGK